MCYREPDNSLCHIMFLHSYLDTDQNLEWFQPSQKQWQISPPGKIIKLKNCSLTSSLSTHHSLHFGGTEAVQIRALSTLQTRSETLLLPRGAAALCTLQRWGLQHSPKAQVAAAQRNIISVEGRSRGFLQAGGRQDHHQAAGSGSSTALQLQASLPTQALCSNQSRCLLPFPRQQQ